MVHITNADGFRGVSHFFACRGFYHGKKFVHKFPLDSPFLLEERKNGCKTTKFEMLEKNLK